MAPEIVEIGRSLLGMYRFGSRTQRGPMESHSLGLVARASLAGDDGRAVVRQVCSNLLVSTASFAGAVSDYHDFVEAMLGHHPDDVLDAILAAKLSAKGPGRQRLPRVMRDDRNPMAVVPDERLLAWCEVDPETRYPFAASIAVIFKQENQEQPRGWNAIARALLAGAPDKEAVFREFVERVFPTGGVGSLSSQYEARLKLLADLDLSGFPELSGALAAAKQDLQQHADAWRRSETEDDRARSGRFEE